MATFAVAAHHFDTSALFFGSKAYLLAAITGLIFGLIIGGVIGGLIIGFGLSLFQAVIFSTRPWGRLQARTPAFPAQNELQ